MAVLMVGIVIMLIMMTVAMPVWRQSVQREKEEELIFRGNQYVRAITLFQRRFGAGYPPSIDVLVQNHFLRKKYKDPITGGDFYLVPAASAQAGQAGFRTGQTGGRAGQTGLGQTQTSGTQGGATSATGRQQSVQVGVKPGSVLIGGLRGVVSSSTEKSIKLYDGRDRYNEWLFVQSQQNQGRGGPGGRGGRGQGGRGFGPGGTSGDDQSPFGRGQGGGRGRGRGMGPG